MQNIAILFSSSSCRICSLNRNYHSLYKKKKSRRPAFWDEKYENVFIASSASHMQRIYARKLYRNERSLNKWWIGNIKLYYFINKLNCSYELLLGTDSWVGPNDLDGCCQYTGWVFPTPDALGNCIFQLHTVRY